MKQESLEAYHKLNRHRVDSQYGRILLLLRLMYAKPLNDRAIAETLQLPINIVESRVCQLAKEGLIEDAGTRIDEATKNRSRTWRLRK